MTIKSVYLFWHCVRNDFLNTIKTKSCGPVNYAAKTKKPENSNLHGFEVHRPSSKGTKLRFQVINAIINQSTQTRTWSMSICRPTYTLFLFLSLFLFRTCSPLFSLFLSLSLPWCLLHTRQGGRCVVSFAKHCRAPQWHRPHPSDPHLGLNRHGVASTHKHT